MANYKRKIARRNPKTMSLSTYMTRMGNSKEHTKPKYRVVLEDKAEKEEKDE